MKMIVTIPDDIYDDYLKCGATVPKYGTGISRLYKALWKGKPLPEPHKRTMSIERAKEELQGLIEVYWIGLEAEHIGALETAVDILKQLESEESRNDEV